MFYGIIIETVEQVLFFVVDVVAIQQQKMQPEKVIQSMVKHYLNNTDYYEVTELSWIGQWRSIYPEHKITPIKYITHRFTGVYDLGYIENNA